MLNTKLYYDDAYLKEIKTTITEKTKTNNGYVYQLKQTIFYPNGGGQPSDKGYINNFEVLDVFEKDNKIFHLLKENINENKVTIKLDWSFRYLAMQGHLAQHLLSAIIYQQYQLNTISHHYGQISSIDLETTNLILDFNLIENLCNKAIRENKKVTIFYPKKDQINTLNLHKTIKVENDIRIVQIEDLENNPCGGLHCEKLSELQLLKILNYEKIKDNNYRIYFISGNKAIEDYTIKHQQTFFISKKLSTPINEISIGVDNLYNKINDLENTIYELKNIILNNTIEKLKKKDKLIIIDVNEKMQNLFYLDTKTIANHFINNEQGYWGIIFSNNNQRNQFHLFKCKDVNINIKEIFKTICNKYSLNGGGNDYLLQSGSKNDLPINEIEKIIKQYNKL